jgi:hypothetical protein
MADKTAWQMTQTELFHLAETVAATLDWDARTFNDEVEACGQRWLRLSS